MNADINIKLNSLLVLSIPFLLITGPFLSDFVIVLLFFSALYLLIKKKLVIGNNLKKFLFFFLIFYLFAVLSSSLSIDKFISLKSSLPYFRYLGLVLIGYYLYKINKAFIEKLGLIVILITFIFFIDSLVFFIFGFDFPEGKMINGRFSSFLGDEKVLGSYIARLAPLGLIFISSITDLKTKKISFVVFIFICIYLIFLSGERTALIMFFIHLLIIIIFFQKFRKILLTSIFSVFIFLVLFVYFMPQGKLTQPIERIFIHSLGQMYFNNQDFSLFSTRHEDHYNTSINIFKKNFFLGGGNKSFRLMCGMEDYSVKESVESRFKVYSQYDDYLYIIKYDNYMSNLDSFYISEIDKHIPKPKELKLVTLKKSFLIYYLKNEKFHSKTKFNIVKFKDFFNKPLYSNLLLYFDDKKISDKDYLKLNNVLVNKNQKLFLYDGEIYFGDGCNTHPHHIYLQIASENGIINLIIITILFLYVLMEFFKIYGKNFNDKKVLLLSMIFIQILPIIPSGNFYNNWLSIFFFLPFGFYFALKDNFK